MPFPRDRFARAGASTERLDSLQADYEALSPVAQASYDARIAPLSDYALVELLDEPVEEIEEASEPEVAAPPTALSSGLSGSSSAPSSSSSGSDTGK